jgi:hypothetical protein
MTVFEPLFILLFLTTVVTLVTAAIIGLRGHGQRAVKILRRLAVGGGVYFAIVLLVAFTTPQKVLRVGDPQCFDDWCITVVGADRTPANTSVSWTVTLRLSSRARRVAQSEKDVVVYLTDARHRRFDPVPGASRVSLDARLQPGESLDATRTFELPPDASEVGLIFTHEGGFPIGSFIIGENQWFHNAAIVRLD